MIRGQIASAMRKLPEETVRQDNGGVAPGALGLGSWARGIGKERRRLLVRHEKSGSLSTLGSWRSKGLVE